MTVYVVWSDTSWEVDGWPKGGLPEGPPHFGSIASYGDVPEDAIPDHLTDLSDLFFPFGGLAEVGNALLSGSLDVFLHDGTAIWDDGTAGFDTLGGYHVANQPKHAYSTLLTQSVLHDDGSFGPSEHLNATEHFRTATRDVFRGSEEIDLVKARKGNDKALGGEGADRLWGQKGSDLLKGGAGSDFIYGGPGNDVLRGGSGNDRLVGGQGRDKLFSGQGVDHLFGNKGRDVLVNKSGTDAFIYGGWHNDKIVSHGNGRVFGGPGDDRFVLTGWGEDEIHGGRGKDKFIFREMSYSVAEYTFRHFEPGREVLDMRRTGFEADDLGFFRDGTAFLTNGDQIMTIYFDSKIDVSEDDFLF